MPSTFEQMSIDEFSAIMGLQEAVRELCEEAGGEGADASGEVLIVNLATALSLVPGAVLLPMRDVDPVRDFKKRGEDEWKASLAFDKYERSKTVRMYGVPAVVRGLQSVGNTVWSAREICTCMFYIALATKHSYACPCCLEAMQTRVHALESFALLHTQTTFKQCAEFWSGALREQLLAVSSLALLGGTRMRGLSEFIELPTSIDAP